ncbi:photosynthetic complex putative assembly protein PuhB [Prosthecomicrobium sp. N25]|uniref:photosynthetic complex putative assembly protein PuhB n=1 Tax=Prosthecomicrobium sp. N25 TaxID=3129254 RepID=UPI0030788416
MSAAAEIPEGLPEALPEGERLLWQGRPATLPLAIEAFHLRKVAAYFGLLLAWRFGSRLHDGLPAGEALAYAAWILPLAAGALALIAILAFATARTTIYTVTSRRVVLRIGVALQMTVNLPLSIVESAAVKRRADGSGDIALRLEPGVRAAYLVLWPHVRRWRFTRPEPSLRSVPDVAGVADLLSEALAATAVPEIQPERAQPAPAPKSRRPAALQPRVA